MILTKNQIKGLTLLALVNAFLLMSNDNEEQIIIENDKINGSKKILKQAKEINSIRKKAIQSIYNLQKGISKQFPRNWSVLQKKRIRKYNKIFASTFKPALMTLRKMRAGIDKESTIYVELDYVALKLAEYAKTEFGYNQLPQLHYEIQKLLNHPMSQYNDMTDADIKVVNDTIKTFINKIKIL